MPGLRNIGLLATCPSNGAQDDIGAIRNACLVWQDGRIAWAGPETALPQDYQGESLQDAGGRLVIPGLVDCHTHLCFGGWRGDEFEMRLQGKTYLEIAQAGGGIRSTVAATRNTSAEDLAEKARKALAESLQLGVTTLECKSGYGLELETELKQLRLYRQLDKAQPVDLVATFLGAHIVPPEYIERRGEYVDLVCKEMLPAVVNEGLAEFCDCYIDDGAFTVAEGRQILETALDLGLAVKIHAEQIAHTGAAALAGDLNAVSAEHLEHIDDEGIEAMRRSGTVAVTLPLASLYLRESYADARRLISAGIAVAVATDFNPGSAPSNHLPLAMTLACLNQQMTPAEVLKGATTIAARALSREDRIGSLLPGYAADLALVDAPDVNHWLYHARANACLAVWKSGRPVWQAHS